MQLEFTLDCIPTAQQRARHMRNKYGHDVTYKSYEQQANERTLDALLLQHKPEKPFEGAVALEFAAFMPMPKSASKKTREAMLAGKIAYAKKPDLDNLAKQLKDAMTRLRFWQDDRQVVMLLCLKKYGKKPCWQVHVREVGGC